MTPEILNKIVDIINANQFASLKRGDSWMEDLRDMLVKEGLAKRVDKPYIGCIEVV